MESIDLFNTFESQDAYFLAGLPQITRGYLLISDQFLPNLAVLNQIFPRFCRLWSTYGQILMFLFLSNEVTVKFSYLR